jgi:glyoxylase-like metal-dependent hydrolase (beta-lactamase superfamily II)
MVGCGQDWLGRVQHLNPKAIVITHAHPDHAWGLKEGAPCPVYATPEAWEDLERFGV